MGREDRIIDTYRLVPLKENYSTPFVSRRKVVTRMIELDRGDDISWRGKAVSKIRRSSQEGKLVSWMCGRFRVPNIPSVMSSTSPLSPKHLCPVVGHQGLPG